MKAMQNAKYQNTGALKSLSAASTIADQGLYKTEVALKNYYNYNYVGVL